MRRRFRCVGPTHSRLRFQGSASWPAIAEVSGIECVGVVKSCPGEGGPGTKGAAPTGGLERTINGSYDEVLRAPVTNVAAIESDLPWADLAAIPETYATARTSLFRNLEVARPVNSERST